VTPSSSSNRRTGAYAGLSAAVLFGIGTPVAKFLVGPVDAWLLAGLLYTGSGIGLALWRLAAAERGTPIGRREAALLMAAIVVGGLIAPVLLMWSLAHVLASTASLLLNLEAVFTALLAWFAFGESFDRRIMFGMLLIVVGAVTLSWPGDAPVGALLPTLGIVAACFLWALDNNLTRAVSSVDATLIAMMKGLVAGPVNMALAVFAGATFPHLSFVAAASVTGFLSYGVSLALFVVALRHLGTARTSAYFSIAPFMGAITAVALLHEPMTFTLLTAAGLMAAGVWLHLTERHDHLHAHALMEHDHEHVHDQHHQHHQEQVSEPHRHIHRHDPVTHSHAHFPDDHHRSHTH